MGKRLRDKDGSKILVCCEAKKFRNRNYEGKFLIRNMTYRKAEERLREGYRVHVGTYGWGR